jgi:predicted O-methyltransferase YrrM
MNKEWEGAKHLRNIRQPVTPDVNNPTLYSSKSKRHCENEVSELLRVLVHLMKPNLVLEVGVAEGYTTEILGEELARNGAGKLVGIDIDLGQIPPRIQSRIQELPVELIESDFLKVEFPTETQIDLAFLDSTLDQKDEEFLHFLPWLKPGAIVVLHDMGFGKRQDMSLPKRAEIAFSRVPFSYYNRINFSTPAGLAVLETRMEKK